MKLIIFASMIFGSLAGGWCGEDADAFYEEGIAHLKLVMAGDESKVVPAAEAFAKASLGFERNGNDAKAQDANSGLYWCKKRMNISQINQFLAGSGKPAEVVQRVEQVSKPVEESKAQAMFDQAEAFEKANVQNSLLIAIRYFEVADRFTGTPLSIEAQKRSLAAMQKVKTAESKPAPAKLVIPPGTLLEKEFAAFNSVVLKARERLLYVMQQALTEETKRGNLDVVVPLKAELERFTNSTELKSTADTKNASVASAQKSFASTVLSEKKRLLSWIEPKVREATRMGNLEMALKLREERRGIIGAPKDAVEFNGHYYKFCRGAEKNWDETKTACEQQGGFLASIETKEEHDFIMKTYGGGWEFDWAIWIGGSNETGTWYWTSSAPVVHFGWLPGQPDGGKNYRMCYWKRENLAWDDRPPHNKLSMYLCEWGY